MKRSRFSRYERRMRRLARMRYVPWNFNPPPRFGLRLPPCRECGREMDSNPIVDLGGGVLVKFGLCALCLSIEMEDRRSWDGDIEPMVATP